LCLESSPGDVDSCGACAAVLSAMKDAEDPVLGSTHRGLAALCSIGEVTAECADLQEVLRLSLERIAGVLGLDVACVALYDDDVDQLAIVAQTPPGEDLFSSTAEAKPIRDLLGRIAQEARVRVIEDSWEGPELGGGEGLEPQLRAFAGAPLKSRGKVLGVLCVGSSHRHHFSPDDLAFLSVLAGQLSWAVESTVLRERLNSSRFRLRERVKELSILYDVSRKALVASDAASFLSFVAERLPASMQYQKAAAVVYCVIGGQEHLAWSRNVDETIAPKLRIVPGEGTLGQLLKDRGLLVEYGLSGLDEVWKDCDMKSVLAVPVATNGEVAGSIAVYYLSANWQFLEEEEHLLRGLSEQVSLYLERAAIERENVRHAQQVSTLFEVSKALASVVELGDLLPAIQSTLVQTLPPAEAGGLLLFDDTTGMLTVQSAFGYDTATIRRVTLRADESMSGKVFESGRPGVWDSPEACAAAMRTMSEHSCELYRKASGGLNSPRGAIAVPLIYRDQKIGVLTLETLTNQEVLSASHLPFLQALAELVVINVGQIQLLQETEQARAAEDADRLRSELIAALAHEMRTPLTSIQGYASALLLDDVEWDDESRRRQLGIIEAEARDLQTMIRDLLESAIVDAGLLTLAKEPVLIPRMVEDLVAEMTRRTTRHRFVISFPSRFPIVEADPRRIEQVLRNLLDNAVKYSPNGGLVVVRGQVAPDEVILSVADNGVGIAPEHLNRLFEKFFRVKAPVGDQVRGTGLGLPLSRTIVESHGGRIWAESELNKGTTIYFSLPCMGSLYGNEVN
jgi:K+-sensing histidine kinase KdpD